MTTLTMTLPDDWHLHFRDGELLQETVPATARCFGRAIVMPNLCPPVSTGALAQQYRQRILAARPKGCDFEPLMTLYLTPTTCATTIKEAKQAGVIAAKLYPAGATTHSAAAVDQIEALYPVFEAMAEEGLLLLIHGEVTDSNIDIFDREKCFIDRYLVNIVRQFPTLRIVFEHITTRDACAFVTEAPDNVAATITPQHLLLNRNDLLAGGIKPHHYCLPVLKRNTHQEALRRIVAGGSKKFFLGTDSAPHEKYKKESCCGCAGCYSAPAAIELYAQVFDDLNALDKLEAFASFHGADFYGLPRNTKRITLQKSCWQVPERIAVAGGDEIIPLFAGRSLDWQVIETSV